MSGGITLAQAEAQLAVWLAADTTVAAGQSFDINGRSYTKVHAREIRESIDFWDSKVKQLSCQSETGGMKIYGGTPV